MNVAELISDAYYLSRVVGRQFEIVSGTQSYDALKMLNEILSEKNISSAMIPYTSQSTFNGVIGQESYDVFNLISVDTLTFNVNDIRYSLNRVERDRYFGSSRIDNINSFPYMYFSERQFGKTKIYVYYPPDKEYVFKLTGKFGLTKVELFDDLSLSYDQFYLLYIKYNLAKRICDFNGNSTPLNITAQLSSLDSQILNFSGIDMSVTFSNPFSGSSQGCLDPVQAQLSNGWVP